MVGFFVCPMSLILFLAMAGGLGSVHGLGEDLDRPLFGPPGSPIRLQESDPGLRKALMFAEERYNRGSNAMHLRRVSRLVSATRQVRLLYNAYIYIYNNDLYTQHVCAQTKTPLLNSLFLGGRRIVHVFVSGALSRDHLDQTGSGVVEFQNNETQKNKITHR